VILSVLLCTVSKLATLASAAANPFVAFDNKSAELSDSLLAMANSANVASCSATSLAASAFASAVR
jgi:hypothetical protein